MVCYPQFVDAEEFTGAHFLQWEEKNQNAFITDSVLMMIIVSGEAKAGDQWADCVSTWFLEARAERLEMIKGNISRFKDFHPQTTIYATAEKACGTF
jgi:hypothetical protein